MAFSEKKELLIVLWNKAIKNLKVLKFFKFSIFFFRKLNVSIEELYDACIKNDIKFLSYNGLKKKLYFGYKNKYILVTNYSAATIVQIFAYEPYKLPTSCLPNEYIVFDVGMNKGFSSMWFAMSPCVHKVIGYEVNPGLQELITDNRKMNKELFRKIESYGFGLAGENKEITIHCLTNDDGITTISNQFYSEYWSKERKRKGEMRIAQVKNASDEIKQHLNRYSKKKYILKIDVEGAEYLIFDDLSKNKLIDKFDIIMGETHLGFERIRKQLHNFKIIDLEKFPNDLNTFIAYKNKYED